MLSNKKGFTLIEMLVSVGLVVLLGIFLSTSYTVVSQLNAEIFAQRKYLHEAKGNFETGKYLANLDQYEVQQETVTTMKTTITCKFYTDKNNGLIYMGECS